MISLVQLKKLNEEYSRGVSEWAAVADPELNDLIMEAWGSDGGVALDILTRIPVARFTSSQVKDLFACLLFWIQGPSRFYDRAVAILTKFGAYFLDDLRQSLVEACRKGDDSVVRGLCHVISLLDLDHQRQLKECVDQLSHTTSADVLEALRDLCERSRMFDFQ